MITLKNLVLRRGTKVLLDGASATINPGEKVGLVGRNGAGKSSLFGLLNKTLHEDKGDFYVPAQWRMSENECVHGELHQIVSPNPLATTHLRVHQHQRAVPVIRPVNLIDAPVKPDRPFQTHRRLRQNQHRPAQFARHPFARMPQTATHAFPDV
jgi:ABC-type cobalamin/Fe3+-siderophores transport system ATPase subunit